MVNYQKLCAYLVGQIDLAIAMLERAAGKDAAAAKEMLKNALLAAEEHYLEEAE